jgi:hypothetical protein
VTDVPNAQGAGILDSGLLSDSEYFRNFISEYFRNEYNRKKA